MLASPVDLETLRYPVIVQPKLDGIRCVITEGGAKTRMLKDIPNDYIRERLSHPEFVGLDGEIMTYSYKSVWPDQPDGAWTHEVDDFNTIQGNVMRKAGEPDFKFVVFDAFRDPNSHWQSRIPYYLSEDCMDVLTHVEANDIRELLEYEEQCLSNGYEGVMLRDPSKPYKFGRSTTKEQTLLKMKRFLDCEVTITGFTERMHNANEATIGELGQTKRSSHQENMIPTGTLGTFTVSMGDVVFDVGTGFNDDQRKRYWEDRFDLCGKTITIKYQELSKYGVPRFPVFLGFRYDLGETK